MLQNRLRILMAERELSATELSKLIGISRNTITSIRNNKTIMIRLDTLNTLLKFFEVTPNDFFSYNEQVIGNRIKSIRLEKGMTTAEFAELFVPHASNSLVSRWERGVNLPNPKRIERIAEIGNITTQQLIGGN